MGSTGWMLAPSRIAVRLELLAPTFPRSGGVALPVALRLMGASIDPAVVGWLAVSSPSCWGVHAFVLRQGCSVPRACIW